MQPRIETDVDQNVSEWRYNFVVVYCIFCIQFPRIWSSLFKESRFLLNQLARAWIRANTSLKEFPLCLTGHETLIVGNPKRDHSYRSSGEKSISLGRGLVKQSETYREPCCSAGRTAAFDRAKLSKPYWGVTRTLIFIQLSVFTSFLKSVLFSVLHFS